MSEELPRFEGNPFDANYQQPVEPEQVEATLVDSSDVEVLNNQQLPVKQLTDEIAIIGTDQSIKLSPEFEAGLARIRPAVEKAHTLLNMDIATVDEDELAQNLTELGDVQKMAKNIQTSRKDVKKYFDNIRDENITFIDQLLNNAGYSELQGIDANIKRLKKDVSAHRINVRWDELKPTFESNIGLYENISRLAPKLADFTTFRLRHPSLVTGAKSFKVGDKQRAEINTEMKNISDGLAEIEQNAWGLPVNYQIALLNDYIAQPTTEVLHGKSKYYTQRHQADLEAAERRKKEEDARIQREKEAAEAQAKLQAEQQALLAKKQAENAAKQTTHAVQPQVTTQQALPKANTTVPTGQTMLTQTTPFERPHATEKFPWLSEYIASNPNYRNIATNDKQKLALLYDMYTSMAKRDSIFYKETKMDAKLIIELNRYILDL